MPEKTDSELKLILLPKVSRYLKQLNLSDTQWKFSGSVIMWHPINAIPYGSHGDIRILNQSNSESWIVQGNIRKINIKSRLWDERHIIQGFQVFLSNGETNAFGMELNDTERIETLEVPADQHIKDFIVRCGWYIDAIAFETNKRETFGPIGGQGGEFMDYIDIHYEPYMNRKIGNDQRYIDGIRGKTVTTQGRPCICELEFKYIIVPSCGTQQEPSSNFDGEVE